MTFSEDILYLEPVYQPRVWGGRCLETVLGRNLPDCEQPYGESWDVSARKEADCEFVTGQLSGKKLTEVWRDSELRTAIFGHEAPTSERFPLLCKVLDAREKLSIQVHPPAEIASSLGGEPKTEMWYIAAADPGATLYVGLRSGMDRVAFEENLKNGTLEECVHTIYPKAGEHIFIPSGRLHAIGGGLLIYEIQQNSDTTYRVYDWNRMGLDGKPRDLHVEQSLQCIDFGDCEPSMDVADGKVIASCDHFRVEKHKFSVGESIDSALAGRFGIVTVLTGSIKGQNSESGKGAFVLVTHGLKEGRVTAGENGGEFLVTTWPDQS